MALRADKSNGERAPLSPGLPFKRKDKRLGVQETTSESLILFLRERIEVDSSQAEGAPGLEVWGPDGFEGHNLHELRLRLRVEHASTPKKV